jgi:hypothetical protein
MMVVFPFSLSFFVRVYLQCLPASRHTSPSKGDAMAVDVYPHGP